MRRSLATKLAVILAVAVAFLWYRQHKNVQFSRELQGARPELLANAYEQEYEVVEYIDETTMLWSDRPYHTEIEQELLTGLHFVRTARNAKGPYLLDVKSSTVLYTLANRNELDAMKGWEGVDASVLVDDVYTPRRMDLLMKRTVSKGVLVIQPKPGGPAQPVFFARNLVGLVKK